MLSYEDVVPQFSKMLVQVDSWLTKAEEYAKSKPFDVSVLLNARLAPDMFRFIQQVQAACDSAKNACARLTGKEAPKHPDNEETLADLRARIRLARSYLETLTAADFAGAEKQVVTLEHFDNKQVLGKNYITELGLPNFYFHVSMAYAILRHNGVPLGKRDFIGNVKLIER